MAGSGGGVGDGEGRRAPGQLVGQDRAAHEMDIVGITVIGRTERDDGLQRRWPAGRDLKPVEAAPGNANHPDGTRTPGLSRQPVDDRQAVILFLKQIFPLAYPVAVAGPAHVDAHPGIAMAGEVRMGQVVAGDRAVALAIGQIFQDRRHGIGVRVTPGSQMRARQPGAIGASGSKHSRSRGPCGENRCERVSLPMSFGPHMPCRGISRVQSARVGTACRRPSIRSKR